MPVETEAIEHDVWIDATPETVFGFFTDPERMVRWMGTEATLDPRPGGVCRIKLNDAAAMLGEFVEVDPYRRIVFSWGWEERFFAVPPQSTVVELSLAPERDGTTVRLRHERLPAAAVEFHQAGWTHHLSRLETVAAGGEPGVDPWRDVATATRELRHTAPEGRF
jgi:uncharacterized protein YndB with AHSA1/START domain